MFRDGPGGRHRGASFACGQCRQCGYSGQDVTRNVGRRRRLSRTRRRLTHDPEKPVLDSSADGYRFSDKIMRKRKLRGNPMIKRVILSLSLLLAAVAPGMAQDWPAKTVRIVVPFGAGSTPDIVARMIADGLGRKYPDSAFVVENKPGASGNTGTDVVAKATPDGSVIGISLGGPLAINTILFSQLPYDPQKDIAPITLLTALPSVLVVPSSLNVGSFTDFVALL